MASLLVTNLVAQSVEKRLQVSEPGVGLSRFVSYASKATRGEFQANAAFWAKDVDWSCASPWNSDRGRLKAGTLVSRRHVVFARHFPIAEGSRILFVGKDGAVCPCRIVKTKAIEGSDIMVGALDYEVTPNIRPAKILPGDHEKYIGDGVGLPLVAFTQNERASVTEVAQIYTNKVKCVRCRPPTDPLRTRFFEKIVLGDSGNPVFMLVGDEPVLLFCLSGGGAGSGAALHRFRSEVQATMDELCPGYRLEEFDFSQVAGGDER